MPIHKGKDTKGHFWQWGQSGKKYYFDPKSKESQARAKAQATAQGVAIHASGSD